MARGLALVLQHQKASADRRVDYIKHRQQIQHRQSMMDRDARNRQVEQERRNQWQSQHFFVDGSLFLSFSTKSTGWKNTMCSIN